MNQINKRTNGVHIYWKKELFEQKDIEVGGVLKVGQMMEKLI